VDNPFDRFAIEPFGAARRSAAGLSGTLKHPHYCLQYAVEILEYVAIPEAHDAVAVFGEFCTTRGVSDSLIVVLTAVELDHELLFRAGEVRDAPADWMLAAEFPIWDFLAEGAPEDPFHVGGVAAEFAGDQGSWA
jgi:hypothetical protein